MRLLHYVSGIKFLLLFFMSAAVYAQGNLSPQARLSLLTCDPGDALYEAFGHTAIRVQDPLSGFDRVYNYGGFNFNQPNFYLNFTRGYLRYHLSTSDFRRFLYQYSYYNRSVHEQELNLSQDQKQAVFNFLHLNSLPQNREYYYDYFFDNCATRPRDVLMQVLGDSLQFNYAYADTLNYTIRGLTDRYIESSKKYAWGDFGIDLGLGAGIDRKATPAEYMYQPELLAIAFEGATVRQPDGSERPLVLATRTLFKGRDAAEAREEGSFFTPSVVFWLLLLVVGLISMLDLWQKRYRLKVLDFLLFGVIGILGSLIVFLWFFTNHNAAADNWNLAWAWPTHLLAAVMLLVNHRAGWLSTYFMATATATAIVLLLWPLIPQDLHEALIPLLILLIIRSVTIGFAQNSRAGMPAVPYAVESRLNMQRSGKEEEAAG